MARHGMIAVAAAREEELELVHLRSSEDAAAVGTVDNDLAQRQGPALGRSSEEGKKTSSIDGEKDDGLSVIGQPPGDIVEVGQIVALESEVEEQLRRQRLQYQQYQQKKLQQKQQQLQQQQQQQQQTSPSSELQTQSEVTPQIADDSTPHVKIPVVTIRGDVLVRMSSALMRHSPKSIPSSLTQ